MSILFKQKKKERKNKKKKKQKQNSVNYIAFKSKVLKFMRPAVPLIDINKKISNNRLDCDLVSVTSLTINSSVDLKTRTIRFAVIVLKLNSPITISFILHGSHKGAYLSS